MGDERHLQLNFVDDHLQGLATEYGVAGDLIQQEGDFLMLADTSVKSTKLNLILKTSIDVKVNLSADGIATTQVTYTIMNPFPEWRLGRDPRLVSELMLEGVYGSYSRVYTHRDARLLGIDVDGTHAGPEDLGTEFNRAMFGRFMAVGPGLKRSVSYTYQNPSVMESNGSTVTYNLYVQKQPGTGAIPLTFLVELPESAANGTVELDGVAYDARSAVTTDLRVDRQFRVEFTVND